MIQKWIKNELKAQIPALEWTYDYKTGSDKTGVVYAESPGRASSDDVSLMFPTYTVYIESSDMDLAEQQAWLVHTIMNKRRQATAVINTGIQFDVIFIEVNGPPIPAGIENKKITYSINLSATIRKI